MSGTITYDLYGQVFPLFLAPSEIHFSHFVPGSMVLSVGSLGCNLGCLMCHNSSHTQSVTEHAHNLTVFTADELVSLAVSKGAEAIVFTYNDPVPQYEWILDVANACKEAGIFTALCTAGFISHEYRAPLFGAVDAVEVSLKGFYDQSHHRMTGVSSASSLESLEFLAHSSTWLEVTITVVPGYNDDLEELKAYMRWHAANLGVDVPLRFARFRPEHELKHVLATPEVDIHKLVHWAETLGVNHVYAGNMHAPKNQTTFCSNCGAALIQRDWFRLVSYDAVRDSCENCETKIPGIFTHDRPIQQLSGKREIIEVAGP